MDRPEYICPFPNCGKIYKRCHTLRRHGLIAHALASAETEAVTPCRGKEKQPVRVPKTSSICAKSSTRAPKARDASPARKIRSGDRAQATGAAKEANEAGKSRNSGGGSSLGHEDEGTGGFKVADESCWCTRKGCTRKECARNVCSKQDDVAKALEDTQNGCEKSKAVRTKSAHSACTDDGKNSLDAKTETASIQGVTSEAIETSKNGSSRNDTAPMDAAKSYGNEAVTTPVGGGVTPARGAPLKTEVAGAMPPFMLRGNGAAPLAGVSSLNTPSTGNNSSLPGVSQVWLTPASNSPSKRVRIEQPTPVQPRCTVTANEPLPTRNMLWESDNGHAWGLPKQGVFGPPVQVPPMSNLQKQSSLAKSPVVKRIPKNLQKTYQQTPNLPAKDAQTFCVSTGDETRLRCVPHPKHGPQLRHGSQPKYDTQLRCKPELEYEPQVKSEPELKLVSQLKHEPKPMKHKSSESLGAPGERSSIDEETEDEAEFRENVTEIRNTATGSHIPPQRTQAMLNSESSSLPACEILMKIAQDQQLEIGTLQTALGEALERNARLKQTLEEAKRVMLSVD